MVEELLAARGIEVSYETVRQWRKFGEVFARRIRQRAPERGDKWHLGEVVITIAGRKHWLWRAVDRQGFVLGVPVLDVVVLEVLVQSRRNTKAARRLLRKLLKKQGRAPRVMITDKLKKLRRRQAEYHARRRAPPAQGPEQPGLNNRAENSHQPTRRRERIILTGRESAFPHTNCALPTTC